MPDPITARVEPQAPSEAAMSLANDACLHLNWNRDDASKMLQWRKALALAIDAHTSAKDAEIERWKREAMAAREIISLGQDRLSISAFVFGDVNGSHNAYLSARASNGATP